VAPAPDSLRSSLISTCDGALESPIANGLVQRRAKTRAQRRWDPASRRSGRRMPAQSAPPGRPRRPVPGHLRPPIRVLRRGPGWPRPVCGDLDNDGALDLVLSSTGGPARVYRNGAARRGHWLGVGRRSGARRARRLWRRRWSCKPAAGAGRVSCSRATAIARAMTRRVHFGLGAAMKVDFDPGALPDGWRRDSPAARWTGTWSCAGAAGRSPHAKPSQASWAENRANASRHTHRSRSPASLGDDGRRGSSCWRWVR